MTTARFAALLAAGLFASACGLGFSTPRAYRCSSDEECRAGWRCLGDSYCHDPAVGVATPCGADGDCAGGWRCLGDQQCHDPAVGVATGCSTDADCAGGWECLGDKLCHDGAVGVTLACVTDGDCAAGWKCLGDKLCHDPALGVATPCVASSDCAGGWKCLGDKLCHDGAVGVTLACITDDDCAASWRCLSDQLCHDPALGVATPCVASSDCAGGWKCLGDNVCHDPALGVTTRCVADGDCAGGWLCLNDNLCHDPAIGVSTPCVVDGDCAASWRCLGDKLCHDPALGASTPCLATADCAGGWRCADRLCRDPSVGVTVPCTTSADCLGGWFCGRDRVCRDPLNPGPFPCAVDAECAGGWRCSSEGVCTDAAAELAAAARRAGPPALSVVSPRVPAPDALRTATPAFERTDGGLLAVQFTAAGLLDGGLLVTSLGVVQRAGSTAIDHQVGWGTVALDTADVVDFAVAGPVALLASAQGQVSLSVGGTAPKALSLSLPARRLTTVTRVVGSGQAAPVAAALLLQGPILFAWPDGGTSAWPDAGSFDVVDVVAVDEPDGGLAHVAAVAPVSGSKTMDVTLYRADLAQPLAAATALTSWTISAFSPQLAELRALGEVVAGSFTGGSHLGVGIGGGGPAPTFVGFSIEYAEVLVGPRALLNEGLTPLRASCPSGELLEDFELVQLGPELALEVACRGQTPDGLLVFQSTSTFTDRLVFERRSLLHSGAAGVHASSSASGVVRFSTRLGVPDLSTLLSARPAMLGQIGKQTLATAGGQLFGAHPLGLALQRTDADPLGLPVGLVDGTATVVMGSSAGLDVSADGGPQLVFALEGTPRLTRAAGRQLGRAAIVSGDDTLYAGALRDAGVTVLRSVLRPAPGFPIEDWVVRSLDGGFDGWLVGNNQLYALQANTLDRWRSTTWPVSGRDVLGVWWAGGVARVGTTSGEVFSLPSRVPVAPALAGGVTSIAGRCGDVVAVANDQLLHLSADGGWVGLDASVPRALRDARLVETGEVLLVVDEDGVVLELAFPGGADGGCP